MQKRAQPSKKSGARKATQAVKADTGQHEAESEHSSAIKAHNRFVEKQGLFSNDWRKF